MFWISIVIRHSNGVLPPTDELNKGSEIFNANNSLLFILHSSLFIFTCREKRCYYPFNHVIYVKSFQCDQCVQWLKVFLLSTIYKTTVLGSLISVLNSVAVCALVPCVLVLLIKYVKELIYMKSSYKRTSPYIYF